MSPSCAGGFDEVFSDPALGDEVRHRKKQERLVRCSMVGDLGIPIPAFVGPKLREHLEVLIKPCRPLTFGVLEMAWKQMLLLRTLFKQLGSPASAFRSALLIADTGRLENVKKARTSLLIL